MAGSHEEASNKEQPLESPEPDFDTIFQELYDWEDQLQDLDFDCLDYDDPETPETDNEVVALQPSKHGGPKPC